MAGRPLPTALKSVRGTVRKCRLNENEPKPATTIPATPTFLSDEARQEWDRIAPILERNGILTEIDGAALAAYCQTFADWIEATLKVREEGFLTATTNGNVIQNPMVGVANRLKADLLRFLSEFGMTPASRSKIHAVKGDGQSDERGAFGG